MWQNNEDVLKRMIGRVFNKVECNQEKDKVVFHCDDGAVEMYHSQDCCENVDIEDICGDLSDLEGSEILVAEESSNSEDPAPKEREWVDYSYTWTFYTFRTHKGTVTIRWFGTSNGYYSESVNLFWRSEG
jgi:hypothetical protein